MSWKTKINRFFCRAAVEEDRPLHLYVPPEPLAEAVLGRETAQTLGFSQPPPGTLSQSAWRLQRD